MEYLIKSMRDLMVENTDKKNRGFPIAALYYDENKNIIYQQKNKRSIDKKTSHMNHAEWLCHQESKVREFKGKELHIIVTVPPCFFCLQGLETNRKIKSITFLFDPWGKQMKPYLKQFDVFEISPIKFNNNFIDEMWSQYKEALYGKNHNNSLKRLLNQQKSKSLKRFME